MRGAQMILKRLDGNSSIRFKRQERGGNAVHFTAGLLPLNDGSDFHRFAFADFNRSANSEFL